MFPVTETWRFSDNTYDFIKPLPPILQYSRNNTLNKQTQLPTGVKNFFQKLLSKHSFMPFFPKNIPARLNDTILYVYLSQGIQVQLTLSTNNSSIPIKCFWHIFGKDFVAVVHSQLRKSSPDNTSIRKLLRWKPQSHSIHSMNECRSTFLMAISIFECQQMHYTYSCGLMKIMEGWNLSMKVWIGCGRKVCEMWLPHVIGT